MRVAVIGVGLIGGSVAVAARERLGALVSGVDLDMAALEVAVARGLIDRGCGTVREALQGAEAAFVAVPVGAVIATVEAVLDAADAECVVTDVGSTKRAVAAACDDPRFVGGHPLAGTERSGAGYARADLFEGATWYLTPTRRTAPRSYERVAALIARLGAQPEAIQPEDHDRLVATISHLPHVLANVLVSQAAAAARHLPGFVGPSLRDAVRVAGAPSAIWTDIYLENGDLLALAIERTIAHLGEFRQALAASDAALITSLNEAAAAARRDLLGTAS
jgi:prephenate dehydrogenase